MQCHGERKKGWSAEKNQKMKKQARNRLQWFQVPGTGSGSCKRKKAQGGRRTNLEYGQADLEGGSQSVSGAAGVLAGVWEGGRNLSRNGIDRKNERPQ